MSKKLYIIILLLCSHSLAQESGLKKIYTDITGAINSALLTRKGSVEVSGSLFYERFHTRYETLGKKTEQMVQIKPGAYYFIATDFAAGLMISYTQNKTDYTWSDDVRFFAPPPEDIIYEQTSVGPAIRKYFLQKRWRPYLSAAFLFHNGDQIEGSEIAASGGLMYHVGGTLGLTMELNYGVLFPDRKTIDRMERIFIGIGLSHFIL